VAVAASLPSGQQPGFCFCHDLGSGCQVVAAWLQVYAPQLCCRVPVAVTAGGGTGSQWGG
jgi:hypothetical protein